MAPDCAVTCSDEGHKPVSPSGRADPPAGLWALSLTPKHQHWKLLPYLPQRTEFTRTVAGLTGLPPKEKTKELLIYHITFNKAI